MDVQVGIETQRPPTEERLEILRIAAARFAENKANISVTHTVIPDGHCLVVPFTMRTTAQYKVIDEIAKGFKMDIWDFHDYLDRWITFPKGKPKSRRKGG
jgi:hypothetical protein